MPDLVFYQEGLVDPADFDDADVIAVPVIGNPAEVVRFAREVESSEYRLYLAGSPTEVARDEFVEDGDARRWADKLAQDYEGCDLLLMKVVEWEPDE